MGLFDSPSRQIENFVAAKRAAARVRQLPINDLAPWPERDDLILEDDTALELGNPRLGSLALLAWTDLPLESKEIILIGPDLAEMKTAGAPFAQIVLAGGIFENEYDCYCELRDAVYDVRLKGMMSRVMPSRQTIWTRINRDALTRRLSLKHLGAALAKNITNLDFVSGVKIIFVTSGKPDLAELAGPAAEIQRIVGAMMKMTEEMNYDCDRCEYNVVCEDVAELKRIRDRLKESAG